MKNSINKLVLGTAQFGFDYGINNFNGKPSMEKSLEMLDFAVDHGIKIFDTAFAYGDAEEILGEFSQSRNLSSQIQIITKLEPNIISKSKGSPYDIISKNLDESLKRLRRDYIDGYLFHSPDYMKDQTLVESFVKLKDQGFIKNIGVSIYDEADAIYAAKLEPIDYIQVPYSIFDQRLEKTDFFQIAKANKKIIFARSIFLQGLFFMAEEKIPSHLENVKDYLRKLDGIIAKYDLSRLEAALLFTINNENIDHVVFGVDNLDQLREGINIVEQGIECEKCIKELKNSFINVDEYIIGPNLWKK